MSRRKFATLKRDEVLILAIAVEEANEERLRIFADLFADYAPEVADLFTEMALEEEKHRQWLEDMCQKRHVALQRTVSPEEVQEVIEAHDLDDAEHMVFDSLTLSRALEGVLAAERQAQAFYQQAAQSTAEPDLRALYQELAGFENHHVQMIEKRLEEIRGSA